MPQKKKVFLLFRKHHQQDISKLILQMIKNVKKETQDIKMINLFCIELYDTIYYYIMFDKIRVTKKLLRLLEELALPIKYIGEHKRIEILKKLMKMKV